MPYVKGVEAAVVSACIHMSPYFELPYALILRDMCPFLQAVLYQSVGSV